MRFFVIGCGSIGRRHARNLLRLGQEVAAYNRGRERREALAAELGIPVYASLEEMLEEESADAAVVCTPQHKHLEHCLDAARKGLHLFIEKPVADTLDGLDELESEVRERNLITHVGCNMRYHFGPATMKEILDRGELGRPLWSEIWGGMHLPDWHPEEDYRKMYSAKKGQGGGAVMDFIHELDLALWLFGEPSEVAGMISHTGWLEIETEDVADAVLRYPAGMQVNLHVDYLQRPFQRGIRIVGEKGWAEWDLASSSIEFFNHGKREKRTYDYPRGYESNDMYVEQMKDFISCLKNGEASSADLVHGERALRLALSIKESSNSRRFIREGGHARFNGQ